MLRARNGKSRCEKRVTDKPACSSIIPPVPVWRFRKYLMLEITGQPRIPDRELHFARRSRGTLELFRIPDREFQWSFVRSGGPGGQNVNKVASKAVLRWNVAASPSLPDDVKARLRSK